MENGTFVMSIIALIMSGLGSLCALVGVIFTANATLKAQKADQRADKAESRAERSEQRAIKAEKWAEEQRQSTLWGNAIAGLQEMVSFHAMTPEIPTKIMNLRIALTELSDGLPEDEFPRVDKYMAGIHGVTALLYERSMFRVANEDGSVDSISSAHEPIVDWLSACIGNLRLLRRTTNAGKRDEWINGGITNCEENLQTLKEQKSRNWDFPEGHKA